jgi:hypothetical protein
MRSLLEKKFSELRSLVEQRLKVGGKPYEINHHVGEDCIIVFGTQGTLTVTVSDKIEKEAA